MFADICKNVTCHATELPMVFNNDVATKDWNATFTPEERALSQVLTAQFLQLLIGDSHMQAMVDYWTAFARSGDPNAG